MAFSSAKIEAQYLLQSCRKKAFGVCLLYAVLRLICIFCIFVSVYSLLHLHEYAFARQSVWGLVGFYALFSIAILLSGWLFAMLHFFRTHWFLKNAESGLRSAQGFLRLRVSSKIGFLYYLKAILTLCTFFFYLLPFGILTLGLFYELQSGGISRFLWYFSIAFLGVLLFVGLYFGFVAVQKYAFCDAILSVKPQKGILDILRTSKSLARRCAFSAANFKLQFFPWMLCSLLILPAVYAVPYYRQSEACMQKCVLCKTQMLPKPEKPIVFFVQKSPKMQMKNALRSSP